MIKYILKSGKRKQTNNIKNKSKYFELFIFYKMELLQKENI